MFTLRPYQTAAVERVISHFKARREPCLVVLPTGAGKSLVISELARKAQGRVLVLAHVKELVEQNHAKYEAYDLTAGIFSAGLGRKDKGQKVTFGSIQSVARADKTLLSGVSLLVIDECHRVGSEKESQYLKVIDRLKALNPRICIVGLTATPYRLGMGYIYNEHSSGKYLGVEKSFFKKCVYELSLDYMIKNKYLTPPIKVDAPVACYDFSSLTQDYDSERYIKAEIEELLKKQSRVTPGIVAHIVDEAKTRQGVMIFTSSVRHAEEVFSLLPNGLSALITGETPNDVRDSLISEFKERKLKFLVNVSVLTTGFDAPHVDLIAIMRPTESISLYQQIVGRGLRLSEGKKDCLVLDYTGQGYDIFDPEVGGVKPRENAEPVHIYCPECEHENTFWGIVDDDGYVVEHFGRRCQGASEDPHTLKMVPCNFRFRFKICEQCGEENDIAARDCRVCGWQIVDPDKKLKEAMELKEAHIMRPYQMIFESKPDKKNRERLCITYTDVDSNPLREYYLFDTRPQVLAFYHNFVRKHTKLPGVDIDINQLDDIIGTEQVYRIPQFIIARKNKQFWKISEKIF